MATAKIITEGNTQKVILPEGFHFDCSEVEIKKVGSEMRLAPKKRAEEYQILPDEEIMKVSDRIIERNLEAYKELAK